MIRHTTVGKKLLVPMLFLLAVNCGSNDKADATTSEPSVVAKPTEVGQDKVGDGPAIPTGDAGNSEQSSSEEIVPIAKLTLAESNVIDIVSAAKDKVCTCKTKECGELAIEAMGKPDRTTQLSASTFKKIDISLKGMAVCMVRLSIEEKDPWTLSEGEILAVVTVAKKLVCVCKDLECGTLAVKTMDLLREAKEPTAPTKKKIEKLMKEMTTCMSALSATPQ